MIPAKPSHQLDLDVHALVAGESLHVCGAPAIVVTIEASVARAHRARSALTLDRSNLLVAGQPVRIAAAGSTSRFAVLRPAPAIVAAAEHAYGKLGFDRRRFERWARPVSLLPRTVWIHELVHRYVFERHALGEPANLTTAFLELELTKELYFLFRDRDDGAERATIVRAYSPPVDRALRHIDAHMLDDATVAQLARIAGASPSTLLRLFRAELGCSPAAYWRNRRLDEALLALRAGRSVAEVAARVGYDNPTAFGAAFRRRFGRPPSAFRPSRRVRPAP